METTTLEAVITDLCAGFVTAPAGELDGRIETALGLLGELAGADRVTIIERWRGRAFHRTHQWVRPGQARIEDLDVPSPYPWGIRRVVRDRQPLVIERMEDLPPEAAQDRASFERLGVKSVLSLPLVVGEAVIGAVSLATLAHERRWPRDLVDRLRVVAGIVAGVLARKHADIEIREALAFERLVAETSATFVALPAEAIDAHVSQALGRVAAFLDLDRSQVAQPIGGGQVAVTHHWVRDEAWRPPPITADMLPWLTAQVRAGRTIALSRLDELPPEAVKEREFMARHGPRSCVFLPLMVGGAVIGVVSFGSLRRERRWPDDVIERLRTVAEIIGSALARKRADEDLRQALAENEELRRRLEAENVYLQEAVTNAHDFGEIVGQSAAIRAVLHQVDQVAATDAPVLLLGETGTGKDLVARAIHARSRRATRPLIAVNCAALPPSLVESELFGHERGAFTGAVRARAGRFELADGSTLFLDEVGTLEPALQAKLLRALQGGEIQRVGGAETRLVDVRVVAATNSDLAAAIREGRFRADLYYRLGVFPIQLPALRERREDIPLLVWHFIQARQRVLGRRIEQISRTTLAALRAYDWPGNVRELQNVIERALILSSGPTLRIRDPLAGRASHDVAVSSRESLETVEQAHILDVLQRCAWTVEGPGQAAERLGLPPSTLRHRMRKLGIRRPR